MLREQLSQGRGGLSRVTAGRAASPGQGQLDSPSEVLLFSSRHATEFAQSQSQVLQPIVISEWLLFPEFAKEIIGEKPNPNPLFELGFALFLSGNLKQTKEEKNINGASEHTRHPHKPGVTLDLIPCLKVKKQSHIQLKPSVPLTLVEATGGPRPPQCQSQPLVLVFITFLHFLFCLLTGSLCVLNNLSISVLRNIPYITSSCTLLPCPSVPHCFRDSS